MLAFDDIQHILLVCAPALTARYEFLSLRSAAGGRAWLAAILDKVHSAETMHASIDTDKRWVTVAFTWNGLRTLGLPRVSGQSQLDRSRSAASFSAQRRSVNERNAAATRLYFHRAVCATCRRRS